MHSALSASHRTLGILYACLYFPRKHAALQGSGPWPKSSQRKQHAFVDAAKPSYGCNPGFRAVFGTDPAVLAFSLFAFYPRLGRLKSQPTKPAEVLWRMDSYWSLV